MSSTAKSGAVDDSTTVLNAAPVNEIVPSGKMNPGGNAPGALVLPTSVAPLSAWSDSPMVLHAALTPKRSVIPVSGALKTMVSGLAITSLSIRARPGSVENGDGCTMKFPGEVNVAESPPLVIVNGTVVKLGGVVSKSNVC